VSAKWLKVSLEDGMRVTTRGLAMLALGLPLVSCGSDITGPPATTATQEAIAAALVDAGILANRVGGLAALALAQVDTTAKLGAFDAVGIQVGWDVPGVSGGNARDVGSFTGIVAWTGLDVAGKTMAEVINIGAGGSAADAFNSGTIAVNQCSGTKCGEALYFKRTPNPGYYEGTSGTFTLQSAPFFNQTACAAPAGAAPATCVVARGTMTGTFDFTATLQSSGATYTQPATPFTQLPAIQVLITQS
jgi:hypothetical protein